MYEVSSGRNVTISISDRDSGAVFHLSLSLERGRLTWLFVNNRSFYPGRPSSSTPIQNSANDTLRRSQCDGGPRGFQHQCEYSLAPSGLLWKPFDKIAIRNTSDISVWNETLPCSSWLHILVLLYTPQRQDKKQQKNPSFVVGNLWTCP